MNNGNYLDLIVTFEKGIVIIFLGDGNGSFILSDAANTGVASIPCSIALTDFNSDNCLDFVIADRAENTIVILFLETVMDNYQTK